MLEPSFLTSAQTITALRTPYLPQGYVDAETLERLLQFQVGAGVGGVVIGGTTGDGHLLESDELLEAVKLALNTPGLAVIANCGSNFTRKAVQHAEHAFAAGAHAAMQVSPYYGMTSDAGLLAHFQAVLDVGPTIIYNVPKRSQDIAPSVMLALAEHDNFIGIKECAGSERIAMYSQKGIRCWSGNDDDAVNSRHNSGAVGVISVVANIVPAVVVRLMNAVDATDEANLSALLGALSGEPNPIPIATALSMTGAIEPVFRLPYVPMNEPARASIIEALNAFAPDDVCGSGRKALSNSDFIIRQ